MSALATIGGIIAIAGAVSNVIGNVISNEQKITELDEYKSQLEKVYNETKTQYEDATRDRNEYIQKQITQTAAIQEQSVKQASSSIAVQNQLLAAQMAEIRIQGSQQEGQAIQAAAVSGFRGDMEGSLGAKTRKTNRAISRAVKQAGLQARLNREQSYNQAVNNYTSAEYQKALYAEQQRMNENELQRNLKSLKTDYDYKHDQVQKEYDFRSSWYGRTLTYLGIGLDFGTDVVNAVDNAGWGNKGAAAAATT